MAEIADKLSVSRKTAVVQIKSLKEKDVITRVSATKNGHWQINKEQ